MDKGRVKFMGKKKESAGDLLVLRLGLAVGGQEKGGGKKKKGKRKRSTGGIRER